MKEILQKALKKRKGSQKGSGNATSLASYDHFLLLVILTALFMGCNYCTDPLSEMVEMHYKASVKLDLFPNRNSNANIINMCLNFMIFEHVKDHQSYLIDWWEKEHFLNMRLSIHSFKSKAKDI